MSHTPTKAIFGIKEINLISNFNAFNFHADCRIMKSGYSLDLLRIGGVQIECTYISNNLSLLKHR